MRKILFPLLLITLAIGFFAIWIYGADYYNVVIIDTTTKKATWYYSGDIKSFSDLDKSTTSFEVNGGTISASRVQIGFTNAPYMDMDGSNNLVLYDSVTGAKTLADLVGSFTNDGWEQFFSTESYHVKVDTNVYSVGYGSFTYVYGDGSNLTNISGSGIPGGSTNDIQYKDAGGDFAGTSNFTWDETTVTIVGGVNASSNIYSGGYFMGDGSKLTNITGAGVPGGSATQVQYKDGAGNFAGDADFTFNDTTATLTGLVISTGTATLLTMVTGTATDLTMVTGTATDFTTTDITATTGTIQYLTYTGSMTFKSSTDYDDYLQFFTDSGVPALNVVGGTTLRLKTDDSSQTIFELYKDDSNTFQIAVTSASNYTHVYSDQPLYLYTSGDLSNYIRFRTVSDIPEIGGIGSEDLTIKSASGSIDFDNENLLTSGLVDGVDVSGIPSTYLTQSSAAATYWQTGGWEQYFSESGGVVTNSTSTVFSQKVSVGTNTVSDVGLRVGNGTDSHSLGTTDDVYIKGRLEVDTTAYIDSILYLYNGTSYGKLRHDGTYFELDTNTLGVEIPTHTYITGQLQVSTTTAVGNNVLIDTHTKITGQVHVDTVTYNNSTEYVYIPTNTYTVGYASAAYFYGDATYLTNVATAAHTHDGNTLQLDGISSDGGAFNFGTSGSVTFKVSGDTNDYIELSTLNNLPQVRVVGDTALRFKSDGTDTKLRLEDYADSNDYTSLIMNHAQSGGGIESSDETFYFKLNSDSDDYTYIQSTANTCFIGASGTDLRLGKTGDTIRFGHLSGSFTSDSRFSAYGLTFSTYSNTLPNAGWESSGNKSYFVNGPSLSAGHHPRIYLVYTGDDEDYRWVFWNYKLAGGFTGAMNIQANRYYVASDTHSYIAEDGTSIGLSTHTIVKGSMTITEGGVSIDGIEYTFPSADGSNGNVLHTNGSGVLTWDTDDGAGSGDNLGNHVATTTLNMASNAISAVTTIDTGQGANELYDMSQNVTNTSSVTFASCTITNSISIEGIDYAWPSSDGSSGNVLHTDGAGTLTWDTDDGAGGGDNLGNHVATTTLNMAGFDISTADEIDIASMTTTTNDAINIPTNTYTTGYSSHTNTYSQSYSIGADTLDTNEFANLDGIDQTLATTSSPTFSSCTIKELHLTESAGAHAASPTLNFGDRDSGFFENSDDNIQVSLGGSVAFQFNSGYFAANGGAGVLNEAVSATNPVLCASTADLDTGTGRAAANHYNIIAGGVNVVDVTATSMTVNGDVLVDYGVTAGSFTIGANELNTTEWANLDGIDQSVATTDAVTFATVDTGNGAYELFAMNQDVESTDAVTFSTVDTGNGAYELFAMNQDVESTDAVTFATVDTGNGAYELFAMNQDVENTDAVTFATVDTGQGANELYDMDQNVMTTSTVTFASCTVTNAINCGGQVTSNGRNLVDEYDFAVCISTPNALSTIATLMSPFRNYAVTITTISAQVIGGTNVVFMVEQRTIAGIESAGTDIFSGDVTAVVTNWTGGGVSDFTVPSGSALVLVPTSVSGDVDRLMIKGRFTKD